MKVRLIASVIFVIIVGTYTWMFLRWANTPVRQTISIAAEPVMPTGSPQDIDTDFYTTKVPVNFRIQATGKSEDPVVSHVVAFESQSGKIQVAITSALLPVGGLENVADYNFRLKDTGRYDSLPTTDFPPEGKTFRAKTSDEMTTFITHDDRYASVSISGQSVISQEFIDTRKLVAEYWQWL